MDIRAEIHRIYQDSYTRSGDGAVALLEAASRFADVAGYPPDRPLLEKLLRGAILGPEHPLMKLLEAPLARSPAVLTSGFNSKS